VPVQDRQSTIDLQRVREAFQKACRDQFGPEREHGSGG
jgi:hypothetical protein